MYQPEIETMPQDQLRALQSERLVKGEGQLNEHHPGKPAQMYV